MAKTIEAVYEEGVFKPLQKLDIKEHEKVELRILSKDQWHSTFTRLIEKIQKKSTQHSSEEIETDITQAVKEARKEKRGN